MGESLEITDDAIVAGLRTADNTVLREVYKANFPMIRKLVLDNSGSEEEAKDLYQDAFIVLYENIRRKGFMLTCKVKTYLYSVARNLWLKQLKRKSIDVADLNDNYAFADVNREMDKHANSEKQIEKIHTAMEAIGEPCKSILTFFFYQRQTMQEIAANMGYTNADNAKNQKYKCVKRLKANIQRIA